MFKILVAEKIADTGMEILKKNADIDVKIGLSHDELLETIGDYDALIVRSATKVNKELLENGKNLKVVGRAGNGVDNIDLDTATKKGIIVVNTPESNNVSTAEHAIALLLSVCRNIPQAYHSTVHGKWQRSHYKGVELFGKTITILGLGRIGSIVAERLKAFGMKVMAYDPYISDERVAKLGIKKVNSIEEVMKLSDFITIHLPKSEETIGIIGEKELSMAKRNLRIVNCARGGLVDEKALCKALEEGWIAGAALDVFVNEPKEGAKGGNFESPLLKYENVVVTPHLGASTVEAQNNVGTAIANQVLAALEGNIVDAVNLPSLNIKDTDYIAPYIRLSETLGKLYYSSQKDAIDSVEITYSGDISREQTKLLTLSFLKGLLEPVVKERVNFVNVELLARNRGIKVTESIKNQVDYYSNLISAKIISKGKEITFAGTIFGKEEPRIVDFAGYEIDLAPTEYMLAIEHINQPGVIGQIGTILGKYNVNIETMRVSKNRKGENSIMILSIDQTIQKETADEIKKVPGVLTAKQIKL